MDIEYKFNYRYNPKSNRLEDYDYSENWGYFITICCKERVEYFGEIVDGEMILNEYGKIVEEEILNIPIFRKNVILDEYVIMPNHIHMNLFLNNCNTNNEMFLPNISTGVVIDKNYFSKISPKTKSLWNIIKLFKWHTTRKINLLWKEPYFAWQKNYYDRIIRNENELDRIRKYIYENPLKWELEKDNELWIFM